MLARNDKNNSTGNRDIVKKAAFGLAAFVLLGAQVAAAETGRTKVNPRAMQAHMDSEFQPARSCAPANGAQIIGGFAGPDDLIDANTGEICGKR